MFGLDGRVAQSRAAAHARGDHVAQMRLRGAVQGPVVPVAARTAARLPAGPEPPQLAALQVRGAARGRKPAVADEGALRVLGRGRVLERACRTHTHKQKIALSTQPVRNPYAV